MTCSRWKWNRQSHYKSRSHAHKNDRYSNVGSSVEFILWPSYLPVCIKDITDVEVGVWGIGKWELTVCLGHRLMLALIVIGAVRLSTLPHPLRSTVPPAFYLTKCHYGKAEIVLIYIPLSKHIRKLQSCDQALSSVFINSLYICTELNLSGPVFFKFVSWKWRRSILR